MSRAFVRESDVSQVPDLPPLPSLLPPGTKNLITPAGARRLQEELDRLLTQARPRLAAAAPDDVDAKRELQTLDQRLRTLQQSLRTAEIVPPGADDGVVRFGATVVVRNGRGAEETYRIVGVDETEFVADGVSFLSPLARALLNARAGERVRFKTPRGERELHLVAVRSEP